MLTWIFNLTLAHDSWSNFADIAIDRWIWIEKRFLELLNSGELDESIVCIQWVAASLVNNAHRRNSAIRTEMGDQFLFHHGQRKCANIQSLFSLVFEIADGHFCRQTWWEIDNLLICYLTKQTPNEILLGNFLYEKIWKFTRNRVLMAWENLKFDLDLNEKNDQNILDFLFKSRLLIVIAVKKWKISIKQL